MPESVKVVNASEMGTLVEGVYVPDKGENNWTVWVGGSPAAVLLSGLNKEEAEIGAGWINAVIGTMNKMAKARKDKEPQSAT